MLRAIFLSLLFLACWKPCWALPSDLRFYPDSGIRIADASVANIGYDSVNKVYYLFYTGEGAQRGMLYATSTNGLDFTTVGLQTSYAYDPRRVQLPDGNYRLYQYDPDNKYFESSYSTDGVNFSAETGIRYSLDTSDNASAGIYDIFSIPGGSMVMLYLGDLMGRNNLRRAISTDNGVSFLFSAGNILGDDNAGGGGRSYVDTRSLLIKGGCRRMFAMKGGQAIYSFLSKDYGFSFRRERGMRLKLADYKGMTLIGFFDPAVIRTRNGRYRMYVTANTMENGTRSSFFVSATTKRPSRARKATRCTPQLPLS